MAPPLDLEDASELIERAQSVIEGALVSLKRGGGVDAHQTLAYDVAHAASALATARASLAYAAQGEDESRLVAAFLAIALSDLATRILGRETTLGRRGRLVPTLRLVRDARTATPRSSPASPRLPVRATSARTSRWSPTPSTGSRSSRSVRTPNTCTGPTPTSPNR